MYLFVGGKARTRKTFTLLQIVQGLPIIYEDMKEPGTETEKIKILKLLFIGKLAFIIIGSTIHNALGNPRLI